MIAATMWDGAKQTAASIEVSDLLKEGGIGVVMAIITNGTRVNVQIDAMEAAELIAALTAAVRSQHEAMGIDYARA